MYIDYIQTAATREAHFRLYLLLLEVLRVQITVLYPNIETHSRLHVSQPANRNQALGCIPAAQQEL